MPGINHFTPLSCNGLGRAHLQVQVLPSCLLGQAEEQKPTIERGDSNLLATLWKH